MFVPKSVSLAKLDRQLAAWEANADAYRRRGWLLLRRDQLHVEVAFLSTVRLGQAMAPVITAAIRLDYSDFDLRPPSLVFIDPTSGAPAPPIVRAKDRVGVDEVRDALVDGHPDSHMPFLCLAGVREYHTHPQHSGDDWLLHRSLGEGDLAVICDRVWRRMARNVLGIAVVAQSLPMGMQLEIGLIQGDADAMPATGPVA
jgi:hypothetical protein